MQIQRAIQRSLAAHGWENRVWAFFFDNALNDLPSDWFDVRNVSHVRVGHDGSWIAVDQNDFVALFAQRFTRLRARVIELARLTNNDGTSADN